ncbi:sortase [Candidatus Saccharibacteria bacterium]|nr:sortase [Candidatus Saccharibacteria bacterium]
MKPDNNSQGGDRSAAPQSNQDTAADLIRLQIDSLYGSSSDDTPAPQQQQPQPQAQIPAQPAQHGVFNRTHAAHPLPQAEQWKAYHSAWQNYYQSYYEQYYAHNKPTEPEVTTQTAQSYFSHQPEPEEPATVTKDAALTELRTQLLSKVQDSAKKVRKSRHFMPIAASLIVVLLFMFLQYNRVIVASVHAYVSPGAISPQNIVVNPGEDTKVSQDPKLIIPKINVDVPVIYGVGYDNDSQMAAMENGVAHFAIPGANSRPGEVGNTVLSGHSSNDLFDGGDYKFIFAQLDKLAPGDTLYANYEGVRYTYVITKKEVVQPNEVGKLIYDTKKPMLTLITCTPLGTALNRLLVTAEQVSPDPAKAAPAPAGSGETTDEATIPGNSPTFLERLFG